MAFDRREFADLYPFQSRFFERGGGVHMHYVDEGAGEPIVMLHGNPTWSFYFRALIADLRGSHRVIAPDHVGCGLSDKPGDRAYEYVLERRIDDVEALLEHLGISSGVTLVLHDWGGMIGLGWAARHLDRVARVVLFNTAGFGLPPGKRLPWQLWLARNVTPMAALTVRGLNAFAAMATRLCVVRPLPERVRKGLTAPYDSWKNRIATLRFVQDIPLAPGDRSWEAMKKVEAALPALASVPTMIAWGEQDFVFDGAFLAEWRRRLPAAEVHAFADAGHYVVEDAGERILPLVRDFMARHPIGAGRA